MGKTRKKVSKRDGDWVGGKLDCGICQVLRLFFDSGVFGNISAYGVGVNKSDKSTIRGSLNLPSNRYICSVHGDIDGKEATSDSSAGSKLSKSKKERHASKGRKLQKKRFVNQRYREATE